MGASASLNLPDRINYQLFKTLTRDKLNEEDAQSIFDKCKLIIKFNIIHFCKFNMI